MVSLRDQEAFMLHEIDLAADPLTTALGAVSTNNQSASRSVGSAQIGSPSASAPTRVASSGNNDSTSYGSGANNLKQAIEDSAGSAEVGSVNVDAPVRVASDGDNARDA